MSANETSAQEAAPPDETEILFERHFLLVQAVAKLANDLPDHSVVLLHPESIQARLRGQEENAVWAYALPTPEALRMGGAVGEPLLADRAEGQRFFVILGPTRIAVFSPPPGPFALPAFSSPGGLS